MYTSLLLLKSLYFAREALCGADIADVVGSMAIFVASTLQAAEFCDATFRAPAGPIRGGLRSAAAVDIFILSWNVMDGYEIVSRYRKKWQRGRGV
eukprot:s3230_g8.t1